MDESLGEVKIQCMTGPLVLQTRDREALAWRHCMAACHSGEQMSYRWLGQARFQNHAHNPSTVPTVTAMVGRIIDPKDVHTLIPGTCEYGTLYRKKKMALQMGLRLQSLRWGDDSRLSG